MALGELVKIAKTGRFTAQKERKTAMKARIHKEEAMTWRIYDSKEKLLFTTTELDEAIDYMEKHPEAMKMRSDPQFGGIFV